ncbi:Bug family tripartite tricarboxylate transporter substrate binding protein [Comamonas resistens]|uniref:Tripartite tricarboxylate transporter substrate binding protein n=1 Tax=Comamonas resistens TaxID=3046670 RepID=A0ABY8SK37_9BURK|nr:tripartite tricarboxylate transporter substrate binding protein [Comamonas resistens]MDL5034830.1 tripartite tricarboxylate transporter substrate binding protein [Comamonas resistens]WHS63462.1 tripartite tricarboxylate transporter substrate binding protein [Comamonas resistens]
MNRRQILVSMAAVGALATMAGAHAQATFPQKPITFVVPYLAGGTTDLVARVVGEHMSRTLGQPVVIENKPGAGGNIGMDVVAKSKPDGYTIGFGAISTNALNPHIYKSMAFDPRKDFTAVSMLGYSTIVLEVGKSFPADNLQEFIAYIKAHPGFQYGTAGAGTSMHLAGVMFAQMAGLDTIHVPYKGSVPGITDMLGGHLPAMFDNLPASLPHIQAGKLKALAVAGSERSPSLPNVPTIAESGLKGYAVDPWFGVYGPAKLDPAITAKLNAAINKALSDPAVKDKLLQAGFTPKGSAAQDFEALTQSEYQRLGDAARRARMQVN